MERSLYCFPPMRSIVKMRQKFDRNTGQQYLCNFPISAVCI
uniref:Uncharacterized protein n=1 Tax=Anguilla anguilla TaxID=7936 RepID=A0A0E9XKK1_ANGAN